MPDFLFAYRTPQDHTPPSGEAMGAWQAWFEGLGAAVVEVGNPIFDRAALGNCKSETVLGGYSLIRAENLQAALALAEGCPALFRGGVEVGEITPLSTSGRTTTAEAMLAD